MTDPADILPGYFALMNANGIARVYRSAVDLGVIDGLRAGPKDAAALASERGMDPRAVALLLEALESAGVVKIEGEGGRLTPLGAALACGTYRRLGDEYWDHLPDFLRTGKPIARMDAAEESERHYRDQAAALAWMLGPSAKAAAAELMRFGPAPRRILDIGAGSAVWSLTIAAASDPAATVTAVDWPAVLESAAALAAAMEMSAQLELRPGNFHEVDLGFGAHDFAVVGMVTHLLEPAPLAALLHRIHRALEPGGRIAIFDVMEGCPAGDQNRTLYSLGLALRTEHGRVYPADDLINALTEASFEEPHFRSLDAPPHALGMVTGSRKR